MKKFNRKTVKQGDLLALARMPSVHMRFKFMGHDGDVVATWVDPLPNRPLDVILRQKDVLMGVQKPRLFKLHKLWYCMTDDTYGGRGYTPADAYREWMARNRGAV